FPQTGLPSTRACPFGGALALSFSVNRWASSLVSTRRLSLPTVSVPAATRTCLLSRMSSNCLAALPASRTGGVSSIFRQTAHPSPSPKVQCRQASSAVTVTRADGGTLVTGLPSPAAGAATAASSRGVSQVMASFLGGEGGQAAAGGAPARPLYG